MRFAFCRDDTLAIVLVKKLQKRLIVKPRLPAIAEVTRTGGRAPISPPLTLSTLSLRWSAHAVPSWFVVRLPARHPCRYTSALLELFAACYCRPPPSPSKTKGGGRI